VIGYISTNSLLPILDFFSNGLVPSYGLAIVALTVGDQALPCFH